eukprot:7363723-Ditylum_brightwellii.AAC.1
MFIPCGQTFGNNTSPSNLEPIRQAREILARWLFTDTFLVEKHNDYTERVQFGPEPDSHTKFTQAIADLSNKGVIDEEGNPVPTPHNMYVDDDLIADLKSKIIQVMSASIEALFILMGYPEPERRKSA